MNKAFHLAILGLVCAFEAAAATRGPGPGTLKAAVDLNPAPDILEVELTAKMARVDLTGFGLLANAYTYNGMTPGPELRLQLGDTVIVHFRNELPEPMSIHWHGIELDNANDGTTVTQNPVPTGGEFTYRFRVVRPGVFWYHPHSMPTNAEFKGLYGPLIVEDPAAGKLIAAGVLPGPVQTHTLMLSDTTVCKAPGKNDARTFEPGTDVPWVFSESIGPFPGHDAYPTPKDLCESPRDRHGQPVTTGPLRPGDIPNITPPTNCGSGKRPCRVNEGQIVLTNGRSAAQRAGTPDSPGDLTDVAEAIDVAAGSGVRLRLINTAVTRYFRLRMTDADGNQLPIYRVGGQGGLLERVRLEGGMLGSLDTKYGSGEIVIGPAERADVVVVIPAAATAEVMTLWTLDYQRYGTLEYPHGYAPVPTVPVAHFRVRTFGDAGFRMAQGDPLRVHRVVDNPIESLKGVPIETHLLDPAQLDPPRPGTPKEELLFTIVGLRESIDGIHGTGLEGGDGDYRDIPHVASSRFARVGDLLEITIRNGTQMHHPIHLHGFSFQPVRLEDSLGETVYEYDYDEFVDTADVPATNKLVFRVRLDDRPMFEGATSGGSLGRWLFHCHIFNHAAIGMMTELVVLDNE
jgi:FtsP/CotA-like multicopper oxidase with cupredoxin domain